MTMVETAVVSIVALAGGVYLAVVPRDESSASLIGGPVRTPGTPERPRTRTEKRRIGVGVSLAAGGLAGLSWVLAGTVW